MALLPAPPLFFHCHPSPLPICLPLTGSHYTMLKTSFGNGRRSPLVTGNALVTNQVLQISQER
jgi:hypothetical protein